MSAPFLIGVAMGLVVTAATGDTEAGGVTESGFFSFFGCLGAEAERGESPPEACVCGEYRSSTCKDKKQRVSSFITTLVVLAISPT